MPDRDRVIIVGGGPVGLVTALWLAKLGTPSCVLEASATVPRDLRASTVDPPTLDMLDELGVAKDYIAQGVVADRWQLIHLGTRERVAFDLSVIGDYTRHPYRLQCEQHKLAPLLNARAGASPLIELCYGATVTTASQDADSAVAVADIGGDERRFAGRYLVGADGAHSAVRQSLGLSLEGFTYPAATTLVTTGFRFEPHIPELLGANYCWTWLDAGSMFRLRDEWRCTFYPRPSEPVDMEMTDAIVEQRMQGILRRDVPYEIREKRSYTIHQRIVAKYRVGRIALAGDAAHLRRPRAGLA